MKVYLMHDGQDFGTEQEFPPQAGTLTQDLELGTLLNAMAGGDEFLYDIARRALLTSLTEPEAIIYRQQALADCLAHPEAVHDLYGLAVATIAGERQFLTGLFLHGNPDSTLYRSVQVLEFFTGQLKTLRTFAEDNAASFASPAFTRLFGMLRTELDDGYLSEVQAHLTALKFRRGTLISARLGTGNRGTGYRLRCPREHSWLERLTSWSPGAFSFVVPERDDNAIRALSELRGKGINDAANAVAQSADHILGFFRMLRSELAFYIGCLNLHQRLTGNGETVCFGEPRPVSPPVLSATGLYDPSLSLHAASTVVSNDVGADGRSLIMITGANQGGKSTFLRSVGLAQLMLQSGMFTPANTLTASVCRGLFTHYKREEDAAMESGKLDEELARMSDIAGQITPGSMLLCNESFASTNEREGSQIAQQIVRALLERGIRVVFVTHLYDLAQRFYSEQMPARLFLRAERQAGGGRTFRLSEGAPLPTSHGEDVYRRIFAADLDPTTRPGTTAPGVDVTC